jgi:hypothetical protein
MRREEVVLGRIARSAKIAKIAEIGRQNLYHG